MNGPVIALSALEHAMTKENILHGRGPNLAAIFVEVGFVDGGETCVIVHAVKARKKFLR